MDCSRACDAQFDKTYLCGDCLCVATNNSYYVIKYAAHHPECCTPQCVTDKFTAAVIGGGQMPPALLIEINALSPEPLINAAKAALDAGDFERTLSISRIISEKAPAIEHQALTSWLPGTLDLQRQALEKLGHQIESDFVGKLTHAITDIQNVLSQPKLSAALAHAANAVVPESSAGHLRLLSNAFQQEAQHLTAQNRPDDAARSTALHNILAQLAATREHIDSSTGAAVK